MAADVFISHATSDAAVALDMCDALESRGIRCWLARRDISAGDEWASAIVSAMEAASVFLLILSEEANASRHVRRELELAVESGCALAPVRIAPVEPAGSLRYFTSGAQWFDATAVPLSDHMDALAAAIRRQLTESDRRPAPVPSDADADAGSPRLPSRIAGAIEPAFVGRAREITRLQDAWKHAGRAERRLVLVSGEPGIGKTTLVASFAADAFADGAVVLYGRSDEELGIPYQPWVEALTHLVSTLGLDDLHQVAHRSGRLVHLVPELRHRVELPREAPSADADAERYLLFGDVTDLLARVSESAPVLLVLDDLHWADKPSLQLLRHVATSSTPLRLLVLATFRDSEVGADHPLSDALAALHRETGVERVPLAGLDDVDLLALLETIAGHEMDDDGIALRDALVRETDGNPFFASEILRHLADTGAIRQGPDGRWFAAVDLRSQGLPVSIREVVGQRVKRLGRETTTVLSTAAVIGRDFDVDLLRAVIDMEEDGLLDILDAAVDADLLQEPPGRPGRYTFAHALIEHTLYHDLSASRRARLHRVVGERLEELCGSQPGERLGELAHHWSESVVTVDLTKPVEYSRQAGQWALDHLAPDEALRWFAHALELLDSNAAATDERLRCELLVGLGEAQRQIGDRAYRETLLRAAELAQQHDLPQLLIRSALANNRGIFSVVGAVDEPRIAVLRAALDIARDDHDPTRAKLLALLAVESTFGSSLDERREIVRSAVRAARATGDPATLAEVLARTHIAVEVPETLDDRLEATEEAERIAAELDDPFLNWLTPTVRMSCLLDATDMDGYDRCRIRATAAAERLGHPHPLWESRFHAATSCMIHGESAEAERLAEEALQYALETGEPDALTIYGAQLVGVRWQQGRLDEIIPLIREAAASEPRIPAFQAVLAWALAECDELDEARDLVASARGDAFALPYDLTWLAGLSVWAEAAVRVGDRESADVLFAQLTPWPRHITNPAAASWGCVAHYLGRLASLLGDDDAAERFLNPALEIHGEMNAPFFVASTQIAYAKVLSRRSANEAGSRARDLVAEVLAVARARGYRGLEREAISVGEELPS